MTEIPKIRPETYSYLTDDGSGIKKAKQTNKCIIKQRLNFEDHEECLQNDTIILRSQQRFKTELHIALLKTF